MTIYELFVYIINLPWWTIPLGFFGFLWVVVWLAVCVDEGRFI